MRYLMLVFLLLSNGAKAQQLKDIRFVPITPEEFARRIKETPIESAKQAVILTRAHGSNLYRQAYENYKRIWERNPNNAFANLWFGSAAGSLANQMHFKENVGKYPGLDSSKLAEIGTECILKAVKLAPNSAWTNMWYGYNNWFWYANTPQSADYIAYIEKAVRLEPNNPTAHRLLAGVHANPYVKHFNFTLAEKEFKTAIRLDPAYADAHSSLADFYFFTKHYHEAKRELEITKSLVPPALAEFEQMKLTARLIANGIKTQEGKK